MVGLPILISSCYTIELGRPTIFARVVKHIQDPSLVLGFPGAWAIRCPMRMCCTVDAGGRVAINFFPRVISFDKMATSSIVVAKHF